MTFSHESFGKLKGKFASVRLTLCTHPGPRSPFHFLDPVSNLIPQGP